MAKRLVGSGMKASHLLSIVLISLFAVAIDAAPVEPTDASKQIDDLLAKSWQKHGIKPNAPVDDATFLRRV